MSRLSALPFALLLSVTFALPACDSGPSEAELKAKKDAEEKAAAEEKAREDARAKREAERKAEEEAEQKKKDAIDALAVIPEDAEEPKDLKVACDDVAAAQDEMMQKYLPEDKKSGWDAGKKSQLDFAKSGCIKNGSIKAAMCSANAMRTADAEMYKEFSALIAACGVKFPKDGGGDAAADGGGEEG